MERFESQGDIPVEQSTPSEIDGKLLTMFEQIRTSFGISETESMVTMRQMETGQLSEEERRNLRIRYRVEAEAIANQYKEEEFRRAQVGVIFACSILKYTQGLYFEALEEIEDALEVIKSDPIFDEITIDRLEGIQSVLEDNLYDQL